MLFIIAFFVILKISQATDGVMWSQIVNDFVPLYSISTFSAAKNEYLKRIRDLEYHNFQKEVIKVAYFQESSLVNFIQNDTKISGVCGELWMLLADYLNFTLIPIKLKERRFGIQFENGSYDGILGLIQKNESQIIPRTGVFRSRLTLLDYTLPLWTIRYHLYIKPEWSHDEVWMFHLFSVRLWYSFFLLLLILSLAGYTCQKNSIKAADENIHFNLQDHILYTIGIASNQGCVPPEIHQKSRIVYICTSMFSWLILIAFSSHAIFLMMNKKFILPFTGLRSLIQESKYDIIAFSGSMIHREFEETVSKFYKYSEDYHRVTYAEAEHEIYRRVCFDKKKKLAAFEAEDRHKAIGKNICRLVPTRNSYFETWIASAVKRGFQYKRSFDIGILKMSETGLIDGLRDRWLDWKNEETEEMPFQSIDMSQVHLIFAIFFLGFAASIIILIFENAIFLKNKRKKSKNRKKKSIPRG